MDTLIGKMERLKTPFESSVKTALVFWMEAIKMVQRRRHQEIVNAANARMTPTKMMKTLDDKEVLGLSQAIRDLTVAERQMRTVLWAALQTTIAVDIDELDDAHNENADEMKNTNNQI